MDRKIEIVISKASRLLTSLSRQPERDIFQIISVLIASDYRHLHAAEKIGEFSRVHVIRLHLAKIEVEIGKHGRTHPRKEIGNFDLKVFFWLNIIGDAGVFRSDPVKQSRVHVIAKAEREYPH